MSAVAASEKLISVTDYANRPENGKREELVRGRIVELKVPYPRHGEICVKTILIVARYLHSHDIGRLLSNDAGVIMERGPDTVRGADVAFLSYKRRPKGALPRAEYIDELPELVFEIRSPTDRWRKVIGKAMECLNAGVTSVCVLDEQTQTARVYSDDDPGQILSADDDLTFPDILPGFSVKVREFFN